MVNKPSIEEYMKMRDKFRETENLLTELKILVNSSGPKVVNQLESLQKKLSHIKYGVETEMWKQYPELEHKFGNDSEDYEYRKQFFF